MGCTKWLKNVCLKGGSLGWKGEWKGKEGGSMRGLCKHRGNYTPRVPGKDRTAFEAALVGCVNSQSFRCVCL